MQMQIAEIQLNLQQKLLDLGTLGITGKKEMDMASILDEAA